jgi:hypothetical protein
VLAKEEGSTAERALYGAIKAEYTKILGNETEMKKHRQRAEKSKNDAWEYNKLYYERTKGHNSYVWAVAKFEVDSANGEKPDYMALRRAKKSTDERKYYDEIQRKYDSLMSGTPGSGDYYAAKARYKARPITTGLAMGKKPDVSKAQTRSARVLAAKASRK